MTDKTDLQRMEKTLQRLRATTQELQALGEGIPAVKANTARILASIRMLELNVSDAISLP
jgi:hypothetical protein